MTAPPRGALARQSDAPTANWPALASGLAGAITVGAMIATPLLPQGGRARRILSSVVVTGSFVTTTANSLRRWGPTRTTLVATVVAAGTTVVEHIGTRTGRPFGSYDYTDALRPQVAGVPAIVPLAWFAMAVPARESAHAALRGHSNRSSRLLLGSLALTAWDLFLDPQMVSEGYWRWHRGGAYRGIPLSNFLGWFVTGIGVMAVLEAALPPSPTSDGASGALIAEYAYMGLMETIGFARYFRDPLVATVGGLAMLPIALAAVSGRRRG